MKQQHLPFFQSPTGDRPFLAMGLLLVGVFTLALQDATVKLIAPETSFWQFQTIRAIGNALFIVMLAMISGGYGLLVPQNWRPVYFRAVMLSICMFCFFSGRTLSDSRADGCWIIYLSAFCFASCRANSWRKSWPLADCRADDRCRGCAVILDPFDARFSPIQLLPVAAGFFYACNILTLRHSCRHENPLSLTIAVAVLFFLTGLAGIVILTLFPVPADIAAAMPFVAIGWPELTWLIFGVAIACSVLNLSGNICLARAYQTADSSWLAPIDFTYLLFAAFWGRVIFDAWPPQQALLGMSLIAFAGILTAWREQKRQAN